MRLSTIFDSGPLFMGEVEGLAVYLAAWVPGKVPVKLIRSCQSSRAFGQSQ